MSAIVKPATPPTAYLSYLGDITDKNVETMTAHINYEIQQGKTAIYLLISSTGGYVNPAFAAYNLLRALPIELTTHNIGNVGSAANILFLAGRTRLACKSSTFFFHSTTGGVPGVSAAALHSSVQGVEIDDERTAQLIASETGIALSEARKMLASTGLTKDAPSAKACGLVSDVRDASIPSGAPFHQLVFST